MIFMRERFRLILRQSKKKSSKNFAHDKKYFSRKESFEAFFWLLQNEVENKKVKNMEIEDKNVVKASKIKFKDEILSFSSFSSPTITSSVESISLNLIL